MSNKVGIFWDYENCPIPSNGSARATCCEIRTIAQKYGIVDTFNIYVESDVASTKLSDLQSCGASPISCPPNGSKDTADKIMIVDMIGKFAYNHPPPATLIVISQDKDFAYAMATLRMKGYHIVVAVRNNPSLELATQADKVHVLSSTKTKNVQAPIEAADGKKIKDRKNDEEK
ncbi:hypothetical protein MD484_g5438, partial [Candolleomyces efflorescens]